MNHTYQFLQRHCFLADTSDDSLISCFCYLMCLLLLFVCPSLLFISYIVCLQFDLFLGTHTNE